MRILLVDDHLDTLELFSTLLGVWGHEVRTSQDSSLAHSMASEFLPEAVFLDLGMPGLDGMEVADLLRRDPRLGGLLLVAVTGRPLEEVQERGALFDAHLMKPVEPVHLRSFLEMLSAKNGEG